MNLKAKFRLTMAVAAAGLLTLTGFWLQSEHSSLLAAKQEQARNLVAIPYSLVAEQYELEQRGKISRERAQRQALQAIRSVRYDGENYFWINDMHPSMVMHPIKPELNGQDLSQYKDPTGKNIFVEMVSTVERDGEGFVHYQWPKPGKADGKPVPKLSFVREFKPWGWVIGTGVYIDDVDAAWRSNAVTAAVIALACLVIFLTFSLGILRSIFRRLAFVTDQMKRVTEARGDFSGIDLATDPYAKNRPDEISVLLAGFSEMLVQIRRRDEQLRQHEEELERLVAARTTQLQAANSGLETANAEIALFLECIPSILIGLDTRGHIARWNATAAQVFGISAADVKGGTLQDCGIKWLDLEMDKHASNWMKSESVLRCDDVPFEKERTVRFVGFSVRPIFSKSNEKVGFILTGSDVTERKCLEEQLRQAHKLEAIGQLAAGIAHEINTPTQFVDSNTVFLKESWEPVLQLLKFCRRMQQEAVETGSVSIESLAEFGRVSEQCDITYLEAEIPNAIDQSLDGLRRVAKIVRAMKEFSHPDLDDKALVDINRSVEATVTISRAEWNDVAELVMDLAPDLPLVPGSTNELSQVFLNLIVNAACAIGDVVGDGSTGKGVLKIQTRRGNSCVEICVSDTGTGVPANIRSRVFEPFFTTKPVGKGTGQGLALAHSIIVKGHSGRIWLESDEGAGTTFFVQLPLEAKAQAAT